MAVAPRPQPSPRFTRPASSGDVDDDRLGLQVLIDPFLAALAAQTRLLEAAERDLVSVAGRIVDADQPVLEALGQAQRSPEVTRVHVGAEAVGRGVGARDDLVDRVEGEDRSDRPEDLLAGHGHLFSRVEQDGGGVEEAARPDTVVQRVATGSASSKTMNGALPPSSKPSRLI